MSEQTKPAMTDAREKARECAHRIMNNPAINKCWAFKTHIHSPNCDWAENIITTALTQARTEAAWREPTGLRLHILTALHHLQSDEALDRALLCSLLSAAAKALIQKQKEPT